MSFLADDGRTEKPTPRRRSKARDEGSVTKSNELNSALVLITASLLLIGFGRGMTRGLQNIMVTVFRQMGTVEITQDSLSVYLWQGMKALVLVMAPLFLGLMAVGLTANVAQVGFKITPKAAYPKFSRINPMTGFKRLFSSQSLMELGKSILKLVVVGGIVYLTISGQFDRVESLAELPVESLGPVIAKILTRLFLLTSLAILLIGILDYLYNRYQHEQSLKMTKEEVKEEAKQSDGDPQVKGKIREIQFRLSHRRMMKQIPEADVVLANPIHLAVALKYDRAKSSAPVVVAKGARKVAERIKEIAREHDIPVIENPPLARALYKAAEIGQEIPVELYKAVAEVLAYVYRLKRKFFGVA
jgi:flagellar biosynthesis protein FlhB